MGLFHKLSKKNNDLLQSMQDYLTSYMAKYARENPASMSNVAGIFANARMMINSLTEKDIKELQKNRFAADVCRSGVLNILQNHAMSEIRCVDTKDLFFGNNDDDGAFDLYMAINEEKLNLGYINIDQYEDNKRLGDCLRMGLRPII